MRTLFHEFRFWEPEESVGKVFDRLSERATEAKSYPEASVTLAEMKGQLGVLFRGLGGAAGVAIKPAIAQTTRHRRRFGRRVMRTDERVMLARFNGEDLALPATLDLMPERALNRSLYVWLAANAAIAATTAPLPADPLQADVARLVRATHTANAAVAAFPGLVPIRGALYAATLAARVTQALPEYEAALDRWIRGELAFSPAPPQDQILARALAGDDDALAQLRAPPQYRPYRPVIVWGEQDVRARMRSEPREDADASSADSTEQAPDQRIAAERRKSDQANRRDSLILNRFESILTLVDFLNIARRVEDDDEDGARKAAQDADKLGLVTHRKRPKTKIKLDLDLAPEDADRERLAGAFVYPEYDWKTAQLVPDRVRVLENVREAPATPIVLGDAAHRRIEAVRRRFESLRPRRRILSRQAAGDELDLDEVVRALADRRANGHASDRLYRSARNEERDLAVAVLFDASRSTESAVHGAPVIEIAREALIALGRGLDSCGDQVAIYAFSSLRRERVFVDVCKAFAEPFSATVDGRILSLKPGFYTRLGAAVRHVSFRLSQHEAARKLLLIITDGKPNDLDHYEGRFGTEDTRRAVMEAHGRGQAVFAVTIDSTTRSHLPYLFGPAGFAVAATPQKLMPTLPMIYRRIVG